MHEDSDIRKISDLTDPSQLGLSPLETLDPDQIDDFEQLLTAMSKTSFGGRGLGEALEVLESMVSDPECMVIGTFSGAMTVAKMGKVLCKMIDKGWINAVISTGALMAHGFIESIGLKHYKYEAGQMEDPKLFKAGLNRVYDTLEPEINFAQAEDVVHEVMKEIQDADYMCSHSLCSAIGKYLAENFKGPGILKSAYNMQIPVYIPAFTDSELALDVASHLLRLAPQMTREGFDPAALPFQFNPFLDLFDYTRRACKAKKLGIFTIGGGVPRNWAQQLGPFVEIVTQRVDGLELPLNRFQYGVRICPEPAHWGGLSGCTYQEGISWGKFVPPEQGGKFAEVICDATIAWPILIKALQDRLRKKQSKSQRPED